MQGQLLARLEVVIKKGLSETRATELARTWSQGACIHIQRALPISKEWAIQVDAGIIQFIQKRVGESLAPHQQTLIVLKMAEGGLGVGSAELRNESAWIGAWEGELQAVAAQTETGSFAEFCDKWPAWAKAATVADNALGRLQGKAVDPARWTAAFHEAKSKQQ